MLTNTPSCESTTWASWVYTQAGPGHRLSPHQSLSPDIDVVRPRHAVRVPVL